MNFLSSRVLQPIIKAGESGGKRHFMNKINWKAKLTSRKLWAAVVGFVGALMTAFAVPTATVSQVTAIIMAFATLIAYIIGEGLVDAAGAANQNAAKQTTAAPITPETAPGKK